MSEPNSVMDRWAKVLGVENTYAYAVARMMDVSFSQVYRWISSGQWPEHPMLVLHTLEHVPRRYWPNYLKERLEYVKSKR